VAAQLWGMAWPKEILDILLVPVALAVLGLLWPTLQGARRRWDFKNLLRRELEEAAPEPATHQPGCSWARHLNKRFLHQGMLPGESGGDASSMLSLNPKLAYELNQMWSADAAAKDNQAVGLAQDWCSYLKSVSERLDRWMYFGRRRPGLTNTVWLSWHCLLEQYYPRKPGDHTDHGHHPTAHDPGPMCDACAKHHHSRATHH
jgi:ABC-type nickel/cobalt efflux system permease component RcnA